MRQYMPYSASSYLPGVLFFVLKYFVLAATYFCQLRLSSVLRSLIALFGMGRDVTSATNHQHKTLKVFLQL